MIANKKHVTQFTKDEYALVKQYLNKSINSYLRPTKHFKEMYLKRNIHMQDIKNALSNYNIIEFNCDKGCKVVIRGRANHKYDLCMSIDILNNKLVTIWTNYMDDNHSTINMSNYNNDIKIQDVINNCKTTNNKFLN